MNSTMRIQEFTICEDDEYGDLHLATQNNKVRRATLLHSPIPEESDESQLSKAVGTGHKQKSMRDVYGKMAHRLCDSHEGAMASSNTFTF